MDSKEMYFKERELLHKQMELLAKESAYDCVSPQDKAILSERVSVAQAAKELGIAPQGVRVQMHRGLLPIGTVVPSVSKSGRHQIYQYLIYRDKLNKFLGKEE